MEEVVTNAAGANSTRDAGPSPRPSAVSPFSRRDFVRTAVASAGLALASTSPLARAQTKPGSSPNDKIRYALIGLGAQGRVLLDSLQKINDIELVAIVDIWPYTRTYTERLLKRSGMTVKSYASTEDLLAAEKDLDAAIVATPDFVHAPITNMCLKAGLDVYCEKMMSNTVEGARSMVVTMRETGKLLQIGHQRRSNPRYRFALQRLLNEAKICGKLTAAQGQWNRATSPDLGWPKNSDMQPDLLKRHGFESMHQFRNWRWFKALGGGPLSDLGAHQIDIFPWFLGAHPTSVMASGGADYYSGRECIDNAMVIYEFALPTGTVRAFYQVQTTTSAGGGYFEYFMGDQGSLKMSENPRLCVLYREASAPDWSEWVGKNYLRAQAGPVIQEGETAAVDVRETAPLQTYDIPVTFSKAIHQPHLENFFNAMRGKGKLNCPADEAFASEYIIHKASQAIDARRVLDFKPEEFIA